LKVRWEETIRELLGEKTTKKRVLLLSNKTWDVGTALCHSIFARENSLRILGWVGGSNGKIYAKKRGKTLSQEKRGSEAPGRQWRETRRYLKLRFWFRNGWFSSGGGGWGCVLGGLRASKRAGKEGGGTKSRLPFVKEAAGRGGGRSGGKSSGKLAASVRSPKKNYWAIGGKETSSSKEKRGSRGGLGLIYAKKLSGAGIYGSWLRGGFSQPHDGTKGWELGGGNCADGPELFHERIGITGQGGQGKM